LEYKNLDSSKIYLITGAAGFIGYFLSRKLLEEGCRVIGIDNMNDYYDVNLKHTRLEQLNPYEKFTFIKDDISDKDSLMRIFEEYKPHVVVNLAAQAGVRYSIENPDVYIQSNIIGFYNVLEACRHHPVDHLVYASTKKSNELMAHTYSHLYNIPATGLRFFTVYGPMGRPDMAYFGFTDKYFADEPIKIFNNGDFENDLYRDFTYIDDIVEGIERLLSNPPVGDVEHKVFNIGNNNPEKLMTFIGALEQALTNATGGEVEFNKEYEPIKPGDVPATYASTDSLQEAVGFKTRNIDRGWIAEVCGLVCGVLRDRVELDRKVPVYIV